MSSDTTLSRQTFERLSAELEDLTTRGRIEIAAIIEAARALGDLKENGDYHAAKDSQGKMEARIRQLQGLLSDAIIVEEDELPTTEVAAGSVVGLRYEGDDDVTDFLVGSIEERRQGLEVISPTSPLGKALMGAKAGSTVQYQAPGGTLKVEIVEIKS